MISEHFFPDRESLFSALVDECYTLLADSIVLKQSASMLVSGGGTPRPLYQQLSSQALDWQKVSVALVDERWVDVDHAASNEAFIKETLLNNNAAPAKFIPMKTAQETASLGQGVCEQRYRQLARPFDLAILGMGPDGHTASLFPHAKGLIEALDINRKQLCVAINAKPSEVTGEFTERMSLSLYGLLQSRQLHLLITGEKKLAVYQQAKAGKDLLLTPISALLHQQSVPVKVYWAP
jgi:6-phosphogluconolactonase